MIISVKRRLSPLPYIVETARGATQGISTPAPPASERSNHHRESIEQAAGLFDQGPGATPVEKGMPHGRT